ncbi:MAG: LamB/YcsF family protein [Coriobacteriia bacterium]|nr:LamB/YcsF family protein [Coriobacteriia bacterium]MCL2745707.1 LamB/YcsF family protein [Coriobacteriia bacterium]MCL2870246.1 LamB/YcsF family protein [Coriobacteriia bacterium]
MANNTENKHNAQNRQQIDINADIGAGFEGENSAHDEKIVKRVTSVNIACGFHGGDPAVMQRSVDFAAKSAVAIGAHVGLPDLMGLVASPRKVSAKKTYTQVLYQLGALSAFAKAKGKKLQHIKLHGTLYDASVTDKELAQAISDAVLRFDEGLILLGPSGSELLAVGEVAGLRTATEALIGSAEELTKDLSSGIDSISVDASEPYAVRLLDELHRTLHKEEVTLYPLHMLPKD